MRTQPFPPRVLAATLLVVPPTPDPAAQFGFVSTAPPAALATGAPARPIPRENTTESAPGRDAAMAPAISLRSQGAITRSAHRWLQVGRITLCSGWAGGKLTPKFSSKGFPYENEKRQIKGELRGELKTQFLMIFSLEIKNPADFSAGFFSVKFLTNFEIIQTNSST